MNSSDNVQKLIRPYFKTIKPYKPIEPTDVLSQRAQIAPENVIKLDGNENLYGCSARVKKSLADYTYYHLYPDPDHRELRKALEKYTGMKSGYILAGSGSDELIDLILRLFLEPGDKVINCPPTFGMYSFSTEVCGGKVVNIPRQEDFSIDVTSIKGALDKQTKVIFITSPNNPSGNLTPEWEILELLDTETILVIDEAYAEFSGVTMSPLVTKHSNLIVLRTFSKWAALAGLRVGYGIFPFPIVEYLVKIKQPYNVNSAAQVAALESLKDVNYLRSTIKAIVDERERLFAELTKFECLRPYPSKANFILCLMLNGNAKEVHRKLQKQGIFIRYFDTHELKDYLRISVGKPEHTDKLIAALREILI